MTISTTDSRVEYAGNGVTTVFPIPFRFLENAHIVALLVSAAGVPTSWALSTNYTLTGADADGGGTLTALVAPAVGTRLVIYRDIPATQETDYISGDPFPAESHERALDKLTMLAQQDEEALDRAIKLPVSDVGVSTTLPAASQRLDRLLSFDATTGAPEMSDFTHTQVASAIAMVYAGAVGPLDALSFIQTGTGAVSRSAQDKAREFVHIDDFNPYADGSDDIVALTAFFNSANDRPGVPHYLGEATYGTSGALPSIVSNNVLIYGATGGNRGVGSQTGSIIKALSSATGTIIDVSPIEGASAQCLQGVKVIGLTVDCNNIAAYGFVVRSVRESEFETCVLNATNTGLYLGVVNTLGEAADLQRTIFRHVGVQIAAPSGVAIRLTGTSTANVSFNTFEYIDVVHTNASAIIEENADNNLWLHTRTFCAGSATNSIEWLGGASSAVACRDEHFVRLSTNKAAIAKGTGSYTAPATNIVIDNMDITNSSPIATEETGATIYDGKWRVYTPTLSAQSGTLTTASATMRYMRELRLINFSMVVTATDIGTATGSILATLVTAAANNTGSSGGGAGIVTATGIGITSFINQGASQIVFRKSSDGSFPLTSGQTLVSYGAYETV